MLLRRAALGLLAAVSALAAPTFYKDVLPVLQNRCQECHRPGEAAPMSLLTYKDTRPWAKAIREAAITRKMPPWFADSRFGHFINDRSLTRAEIETITAWVDGGAREGNPKDAPAPRKFAGGWAIGQPELVFDMPNEFAIPASGTVDYQYIVIPTNFTEDRWVQAAEARPGNRAVVHHIIAFVREPGSTWMREARPGIPFVPQRKKEGGNREGDGGSRELLVGYAPGTQPAVLQPGQAKLVKAGSDLVLQMHYTANGKAAVDRSRIGLIFAKEPPRERIFTAAASNSKFVIPPGDPNYEVKSEITFQQDTRITDFMPHMHLRGKDFEFRLVYPTGETQTALRVPKYDFNWQLFYYVKEPIVIPKGTRLECTAHFDNSRNNPANPDASAEVRWGDQSWEEMMIGWFDIAVDPARKPADVLRRQQRQTD